MASSWQLNTILPWRENLFSDDNIFGFAAQCLEFKRRGYKSVVANQNAPWLQINLNRMDDDMFYS